MPDTVQIINGYLDTSTGQLKDSAGDIMATQDIFTRSQILFRLTCYEDFDTKTPVDFSSETFLGGIDSVYTSNHNDLVTFYNSAFNTVAWADPANGKITFLVDTTSAALDTYMGTTANQTGHMGVWILNVDSDEYNILELAVDVNLRNIVCEPHYTFESSSSSSSSSLNSSSSSSSSP